jgi:hypothetical protein
MYIEKNSKSTAELRPVQRFAQRHIFLNLFGKIYKNTDMLGYFVIYQDGLLSVYISKNRDRITLKFYINYVYIILFSHEYPNT